MRLFSVTKFNRDWCKDGDGLSPLAVLGRGYSVTWDASRTRIIRDASMLKAGDEVSVTLEHGAFDATVTRVRSERE